MKFSPTKDYLSVLTPASDYVVELSGIKLNLQPAKTISISRTISGGAAISKWESSIEGTEFQFSTIVSREKYEKLTRINETDVDEWLWRVQGRIFVVVFDLLTAMPMPDTMDKYGVTIRVVISEEVV